MSDTSDSSSEASETDSDMEERAIIGRRCGHNGSYGHTQ